MELFKILGTIAVSNSDANEAIDETTGKAEDSAEKVSSAFSKIGNAALMVGKVVVTGLAVATTAIVALTAQSVQAYANYEQLVGGVETLFKDAQDTVMGYAEEAYKTAGMSANQYLETVTGFSASLIQSLEGDTQTAAEKANQAILDMSDNANKMGTDIGSLQYAYQGFAKQNYTMLDNLKLGYGGTKEEMERLLADAEKLSGVKYDISSYADIVDAIHVVQTEMGITGTTAAEASDTITGSAASMKAAWDNLVTGLGDDNADLTELTNVFIDSLLTSADNMLPRIEKILGGIGVLVEQLAPKIAEKLPGMLESILPGLLTGAVSLLSALTSALPGLLQILLNQVPFVISELGSALEAALPILISTSEQIFGQLFGYIFNDLLGMDVDAGQIFSDLNRAILAVGESLIPLIPVLSSFILDTIPLLVPLVEEILPIVADLLVIIAPLLAVLVPLVTDLVSMCINSLMPAFSTLCDYIKTFLIPAIDVLAEWLGPVLGNVFSALKVYLDGLVKVISGTLDMVMGIFEFWISVFSGNWQGAGDAFMRILQGFLDIILGLLEMTFFGIIAFFKIFWDDIKAIAVKAWEGIVSFFTEVFPVLYMKFEEFRLKIRNWLLGLMVSLYLKVEEFRQGILDRLLSLWNRVKSGIETAKQTVSDIFDKIVSVITNRINNAVKFVKDGIEKLKSFFDFEWSLPSLKMPHFKIEGEFSLNPPSVPSLGVDWYAKGAVLNEPTAFGMNGNKLMVGGEAGPEAVAPISTLQKYVADAVASQNADLVEVLYKILAAILSMDGNMGANMREALAGTSLDIDRREFARLVKAVN